jgi:hypothetical protein
MALPGHERDTNADGSILRELILNQYQAILMVGVILLSLVAQSPLPLLIWLGAELVTLPILDSAPLRRWMLRRRREKANQEAQKLRKKVVASLAGDYARRYAAMESLCRQIEANYQGLHGISQVYLAEQRGKLDQILDGCVERMTALQRYERTLAERAPQRIEKEIARLEEELAEPGINERTRAAIANNLELKRRLLASHAEAVGTMKALSTELDSMSSLLEVLHQSSISMRDPEAIADELDSIVRQSESSGRVVREMEALLREGPPVWGPEDVEPAQETQGSGRGRRKVTER